MTKTDELMALALVFADSHVRLEGANTTQSLQICSFRVKQDEEALRTAIATALDEARADERERCAKLCDALWEQHGGSTAYGCDLCAAAIRKGPTP